MNDVDLEMAAMTARANLGAAARKAGRCPHYSLQHRTCPDCGLVTKDDRSWAFAMACAEERECWACGDTAVTHDGRCEVCTADQLCTAPAMFGAW